MPIETSTTTPPPAAASTDPPRTDASKDPPLSEVLDLHDAEVPGTADALTHFFRDL